MAKKSIGATLSLQDNNFFSNIKSAITGTNQLKGACTNATGSLDKMGKQGNSTGGIVSKAGSMIGSAFKVAGTAIVAGASAAVAGLGAMIVKSADAADEIDKMSIRTGLSKQTLQELRFASSQCGVNFDALQKAAVRVAKSQGDAINGSKTNAEAFKTLGVSIKTTSGDFRKGSDVFMETVTALSKVENEGKRNYLGVQLLGKGYTELAPLIASGSTSLQEYAKIANETGMVLSDEGIAANVKFKDSMDLVKRSLQGASSQIATQALPIVNTFLDKIITNIPKIQNVLKSVFDTIQPGVSWLLDTALPFLGNLFVSAWSYGVSAFENIKNAVANNMPKFQGLIDILFNVKNTMIGAFEGAKPVLNWLKDVALPAVVDGVGFVVEGATNLYNFISNNWNAIEPIVWGIVAAFTAYKVITMAVNTWNAICAASTAVMTAAQWALNTAFYVSPIGWVVLAIGALVAIGIVLWKNWDKIAKFFVDCWNSIKSGAVSAWNTIAGAFTAAAQWFNTTVVQPIWRVFEPIITGISSIFLKIWEIITVLFGVLANWFNSAVIQPVIGFFAPIITTIGGFFQGLWNNIVAIYSGVASWFGGVFSNAYAMVTNAFSGVVTFFSGIWNNIKSLFTTIGTVIGNAIGGAFKSVVNSIISFAENTINGFIRSINWAIDVINNIPGVSITKLATISVPKLAEGGIIARSGRVMVGERGPEYLDLPRGAKVTPLHKAGNTNNITINVYADGKSADEIVDEVVPRLKLALANL